MRAATVARDTKETQIHLALELDGSGQGSIDTGCGFLNHMLELHDSIPLRRSLRTRCHAGDSLAFVEWQTKKEIKKIWESETLMEQVREKAKKRGYDEATMVRLDARWMVNRKIAEGHLVFQGKPKKCVTPNSVKENGSEGEPSEMTTFAN